MSQLRLCFAGTPAFAAEHLSCLIDNDFQIAAVYTQPDRPSGRGKKLQASPVKKVAVDAGLSVYQPASLREEDAAAELKSINPDLLVVVAYGLILPQAILDVPKFGCINVHASLLPRWRGAAPIERALLAGDKVSGVTIMRMDAGLDTGPMLHKQTVDIDTGDDRVSLTDKLSLAGQTALVHTLENLNSLIAQAKTQNDNEATYAEKLSKSEAQIDWNKSAEEIVNTIRAGVGRAPAYTFIADSRIRILKAEMGNTEHKELPGTILKITKEFVDVSCGNSTVKISKLQLPGKNPISVLDLLNSGNELVSIGSTFSSSPDS